MASVTSMLTVSIQVKESGLGLEFSVRKVYAENMVMDGIRVQF